MSDQYELPAPFSPPAPRDHGERRATFRDLAGDVWVLKINYGNAEDVLQTTGVDFVNAHNGKAFGAVVQDDRRLVTVLACLLEKQIQQRNLEPRGFAERLDGSVLADALDALRVAIELFTRPDVRPAMITLNDQIEKTRRKAIKKATAKLSSPMAEAAIDRALATEEARVDRMLASVGGDSPPSLPE